jgi:hypothetical protein
MLMLCSIANTQAPGPARGYIPDEKTAVRVGEAILSPIYGDDQIRHEEPFHATLNDGVWTVSGSLPPNSDGGVAVIRLDKKTGAVISYIHGK